LRSLWFIVPAHGRFQLTAICLAQLRRTCENLRTEAGIDATAVVIGDDFNLRTARMMGFGTISRGNQFPSKKFNDGIQLACDPQHNPRPADFVVPFGSDDWIDWRLFTELPGPDTVYGFQRISFVREDGRELASKFLNYPGGSGIRIYPRTLMHQVGYRPGDEDRDRGCDTSILNNIERECERVRVVHRLSDPRQIVDWKSKGEQLNDWGSLERHHTESVGDPWTELDGFFPNESLQEMRAHYERQRGLVTA